jgi:hypothetical protein
MKRSFLLLVAAAALLLPSTALAGGVVLKVQRASHLAAVAVTAKKVSLVHTGAKLSVGQRVSMTARTLRNGTLAASSIRVVGRAHTVRFRGLLLKRTATSLVVSAGGAVISVHRSRTTSSARDGAPPTGSTIDVTATVEDNGELDDDDAVTVTPVAPGGKIEGRLTLGTGTVTVTSEHMSLVLKVPTGFDLSTFVNNEEVLATFTQGADGSLTLTALAGDENAQEADDDNGDHDGGGDDGGGGGGDDGGGHDG